MTTTDFRCVKYQKIDIVEFIKQANQKHNFKYFYDKSIFKNKKTKLIITCPKHGDFEQIADNHLRGNGCMRCSGKHKSNLNEFIKKSIEKHGDKYDYSKVEYVSCKEKIKIICPKHGLFEQTPNNHLTGYGCSKCANNEKLTTFQFVNICREVHKNKFSYERSEYKNNKSKITVTCPEHGDFEILASNHIRGTGCSKCSLKYKPNNLEFIERCKNLHQNKYDYSRVDYKKNSSKIKIICPSHGEFEQRASHHLNGVGCPNCAQSSGEQLIEVLLKKNKIDFEYQFQFEDLKINKNLRFDFGILKNDKLEYLIEYNGIQHYERRVKFQKCEEDFYKIQYSDKMKIDYCLKNNINLHIIKYNEDIKESLEKIIKQYDTKENG
jgi:hypothetical protein